MKESSTIWEQFNPYWIYTAELIITLVDQYPLLGSA